MPNIKAAKSKRAAVAQPLFNTLNCEYEIAPGAAQKELFADSKRFLAMARSIACKIESESDDPAVSAIILFIDMAEATHDAAAGQAGAQ